MKNAKFMSKVLQILRENVFCICEQWAVLLSFESDSSMTNEGHITKE